MPNWYWIAVYMLAGAGTLVLAVAAILASADYVNALRASRRSVPCTKCHAEDIYFPVCEKCYDGLKVKAGEKW